MKHFTSMEHVQTIVRYHITTEHNGEEIFVIIHALQQVTGYIGMVLVLQIAFILY